MHSKISSLLIFLLFSLHLSFSAAAAAKKCNPSDLYALLQIKSHFHVDDITWGPKNSDCCDWFGIQCNAHGRVTSLGLQLTPDVGYDIPLAVGYLPYLESLRISLFGKLSGSIPKSIARLTNLKSLDFSGNNLTGPIPASLGRLTKLTELNLAINGLTGPIPASLGQLTSLTNLDLDLNKLSGPIPATLGQLTKLTNFDLSSNRLSGPIPASLSHLTKATRFDLRSNRLTGSIPASFGALKNPEMLLSVGTNRLSGPIPRAVGEMDIMLLDLSYNKFTGDASFLLGRNKKNLDTLYLDDNKFQFDMSKVEFPISLRNLDIRNNRIYGSLPKQLGQLRLKFLDVSHNMLCGPIPTGRRIKQISPEKFEHNKCLCGLPLPVPCKH